MRILYIHQNFSTPEGSIGTRSYDMAQQLIKRGHHVTMICGRHRGAVSGVEGDFVKSIRRGTVAGIDVIEIEGAYAIAMSLTERFGLHLKFALHASRLALTEDYKLVIATCPSLATTIPAMAARWLRGKKFLLEIREIWPEYLKAMGISKNPLVLGALSALTWMAYHSAHRIIALAPGIAESIHRRGIPREHITTIANSCTTARLDTPANSWRPETVAPDALLAIYAGVHTAAQDLDAILDAAAILKQRGRDDIRILLIGEGKRKPELTERAHYEHLTNVLFFNPVNKESLAGLLQGADLALQVMADLPAFYHGAIPMRYFDYLSAGLPILTNYPGFVADTITAQHCGFVVMPQNPAAFADALERAANDRAALKTMSESSRTLATREHQCEPLAEQFVNWAQAAARA